MVNRKNKLVCFVCSSAFLVFAVSLSGCSSVSSSSSLSSNDESSSQAGSSSALTLLAPTITLTDGLVSWNAITNASSYLVNVDGTETGITDTHYSLASLSEPKDYVISVKAVNGDVTSAASNSVTYVLTAVLNAPALSLSGNLVSWASITNATSYEVYVNDASVTTVEETHYAITEENAGDYSVKIKALSSDSHYLASSFSNVVTYTIAPIPEPVKLVAPVISLTDALVSWSAVENAATYEVYVNDALKDEVTALSYDLSSFTAGTYTVQIDACNKASSDYVTSDKSNAVQYTVAAFSFASPIIAYYPSADDGNILLKDTDEGIMHELVPASSDDLSANTWYFEPVNGSTDTYFIKLYNGYYLTYSGSTADGSESIASPKIASDQANVIDQEWKFTKTDTGYDMQNLGHMARWGNYYFGKVDGKMKFGSGLKSWILNNNKIAYANKTQLASPVLSASGYTLSWTSVNGATAYEVYVDGVLASTVSETNYQVDKNCKVQVKAISSDAAYFTSYFSNAIDCSDLFSKKVWAYYNDGNQTLGYVDTTDNDIFKIGPKYTTVTDYSAYEWTVKKIDGTDHYLISFDDGKSLSYFDNSNPGEVAQAKAVSADANDAKQQWKLVNDGTNAYKLENVYLANFYSNVYLGEYYGVYKFNGVCRSWIFANV